MGPKPSQLEAISPGLARCCRPSPGRPRPGLSCCVFLFSCVLLTALDPEPAQKNLSVNVRLTFLNHTRGPNKVAILLIGAKVVALRSLKNFHWLRERRNMAKGTGDKMCQGGLRTRRLCEKITAEKSPLHQERKLELDKPPKLLALPPPSPPCNPSPSFSCNR